MAKRRTKKPRYNTNNLLILVIILLVVLICIASLAIGLYLASVNKSPSTNVTTTQSTDVVGQVGKLVELPNETPTIEVLKDTAQYAGVPFFINAKPGDILLIFKNSRKAIIYRQNENRIINIGPISY